MSKTVIHWIRIDEQLPPNDDTYLVTFRWREGDNERYVVALRWDWSQQYWYESSTIRAKREVFAWAEFPKPYDDEGEAVDTDKLPSLQ
jgi:hypothetical protein